MPQHPQTPSRHDNPTSIDDLLTHAEQTVRDMTLRDPLPAPSPPARDARLRYDTPRHHEAHLRLREHLAAWPALADATHRLLIDLDRRDDAPHLLLTALTSLQQLPQLDAPEPYLVRATTLLHAAADLAHGRDTPAAAISERTGHICGRALAMLDTAVHATQTLGAESTRPNRKNQLLARPTTPELRALRTLTQLRTQIADISPYYGRADHAGIDAHAYGARARLAELVEKADDKRAAVIALTVALAACEAEANREHWRTPTTTTRRYLRALQTWGYQLVEVEQRAAELWTEPDNTNSTDSGDDDGGDDDGDGTA